MQSMKDKPKGQSTSFDKSVHGRKQAQEKMQGDLNIGWLNDAQNSGSYPSEQFEKFLESARKEKTIKENQIQKELKFANEAVSQRGIKLKKGDRGRQYYDSYTKEMVEGILQKLTSLQGEYIQLCVSSGLEADQDYLYEMEGYIRRLKERSSKYDQDSRTEWQNLKDFKGYEFREAYDYYSRKKKNLSFHEAEQKMIEKYIEEVDKVNQWLLRAGQFEPIHEELPHIKYQVRLQKYERTKERLQETLDDLEEEDQEWTTLQQELQNLEKEMPQLISPQEAIKEMQEFQGFIDKSKLDTDIEIEYSATPKEADDIFIPILGVDYKTVKETKDFSCFAGKKNVLNRFLTGSVCEGSVRPSTQEEKILFHIRIPKGSKALYTRPTNMETSPTPRQTDMIIQCGGTYEIQGIHYTHDFDNFYKHGRKVLIIQMTHDPRKGYRSVPLSQSEKKDKESMSPYSKERKDSALWYRFSQRDMADTYFNMVANMTGHSTGKLPKEQEKAIWEYSKGSKRFNHPLIGLYREEYLDQDKGEWMIKERNIMKGAKNVNIDYHGNGKLIRDLTKLIASSTYENDMWLQSGQGYESIGAFLELEHPKEVLESLSNPELEERYVGRRNKLYNFISTTVCKGGAISFNSSPVKFNIYAPRGSQMIYMAEGYSFYRNGEQEMLLQRGGTYEISRIYWGQDPTDNDAKKLFVDMEIHPEAGYDLFQQDEKERALTEDEKFDVRHQKLLKELEKKLQK